VGESVRLGQGAKGDHPPLADHQRRARTRVSGSQLLAEQCRRAVDGASQLADAHLDVAVLELALELCFFTDRTDGASVVEDCRPLGVEPDTVAALHLLGETLVGHQWRGQGAIGEDHLRASIEARLVQHAVEEGPAQRSLRKRLDRFIQLAELLSVDILCPIGRGRLEQAGEDRSRRFVAGLPELTQDLHAHLEGCARVHQHHLDLLGFGLGRLRSGHGGNFLFSWLVSSSGF